MLRVTDILEVKPAGHQRLPDRLCALRTGHPLVQLDDDRANPREIHVPGRFQVEEHQDSRFR
jgi:hypothetical protein